MKVSRKVRLMILLKDAKKAVFQPLSRKHNFFRVKLLTKLIKIIQCREILLTKSASVYETAIQRFRMSRIQPRKVLVVSVFPLKVDEKFFILNKDICVKTCIVVGNDFNSSLVKFCFLLKLFKQFLSCFLAQAQKKIFH